MILEEKEIQKLSSTNQRPLIENMKSAHLGNVAYDLTVKNVCWVDEKGTHQEKSRILKPGESIFVSSEEILNIPNNMIGIIIPRNSSIRMGLDITAPVYQPGHRTRTFVRITNIAGGNGIIKAGDSIFSIMFNRLSADVTHPYNGQFKDEIEFNTLQKTTSVQNAIFETAQKEKNEIESMTKNIYATVVTLMAIFIAMFSVFNTSFLRGSNIGLTNWKDILLLNLVLLGMLAAFVSMISSIIQKENKKTAYILISLFVLCLAGSLILITL